MPTGSEGVCNTPPVEIRVVRWKPLVFEPSTTVLRIVCSSDTGFASRSAAVVKAMSRADVSCLSGG